MQSKISSGVTVIVETYYQQEYSNPLNQEFMFAYRITIENNNPFPIQLLRRHWHIYETSGICREVEGEGVIGVQPIIESGSQYQYISGCNLRTEMGKMYGVYQMANLNTQEIFQVQIPSFEMVAPFKLN